MTIFVLDPGHGGREQAGKSTPHGARLPNGGYEKELTLEVCRQVAARLPGRAVLTRNDDRNVSLAGRLGMACSSDADAFVSVHAHDGSHGRGSRVWVHSRCNHESHNLANSLAQQLSYGASVQQAELAVLTPERLGASAGCMVELDVAGSSWGPGVVEQWSTQLAQGLGVYSSSRSSWGRPHRGRTYGAALPDVLHATALGHGMLSYAKNMHLMYGAWLLGVDPYDRLDMSELLRNTPRAELVDKWPQLQFALGERREMLERLPGTWQVYEQAPLATITDGLVNPPTEPRSGQELREWVKGWIDDIDKFLEPKHQATTTAADLLNFLAREKYITGVCGISAALLARVAKHCLVGDGVERHEKNIVSDTAIAAASAIKDAKKAIGDKIDIDANQALIVEKKRIVVEENKKIAAMAKGILNDNKDKVVGIRFGLSPHAYLYVADKGTCAAFSSYFGKVGLGGSLRLHTHVHELGYALEQWDQAWVDQGIGRGLFGYGPGFDTAALYIHEYFIAPHWVVADKFGEWWVKTMEADIRPAWKEAQGKTLQALGIKNILM